MPEQRRADQAAATGYGLRIGNLVIEIHWLRRGPWRHFVWIGRAAT